MNKVVLMGRIAKDVFFNDGDTKIAKYSLAVQRIGKKDQCDFITCVAWNKSAEFARDYFKTGMRVCVSGRLITGKYKAKDGHMVYTTEVSVDEQEFAQSKNEALETVKTETDDFEYIGEDIDEELPFN